MITENNLAFEEWKKERQIYQQKIPLGIKLTLFRYKSSCHQIDATSRENLIKIHEFQELS